MSYRAAPTLSRTKSSFPLTKWRQKARIEYAAGLHGLAAIMLLKLVLKLDIGPEYDTNANRAEDIKGMQNVDPAHAAALLRLSGRVGLLWLRGINTLRVSGTVAGKIFFDSEVFDQTAIVGQLNVDERVALNRRIEVGVVGDYYDVSQVPDTPGCADAGCLRFRDFRSGTALFRLGAYGDTREFSASVGYHGFQFKPDADYNFRAPQFNAGFAQHWRTGASKKNEWDLSLTYQFERRFYSGLAEVNSCADNATTPDCMTPTSYGRADWFQDAGVEATFVHWFLLSLAYQIQYDASNSFGQSLLRHIVTLKLGVALPAKFYLTVKGQLFASSYLDGILVSPTVMASSFVSIDDENRNAAIVDLDRPIGRGFSLSARYSLYTNELSNTPTRFLRQTAYLGMSYRFQYTRR